MVYIVTETSETKFPNFNPPHHEVAIKYSPINTTLCFYLILTFGTIQSLSLAHHYICLLDHHHTSLLFFCLIKIYVNCKWKETRREIGWGGRYLQCEGVSLLRCRNGTHCCTRQRMFRFHNSTKLLDRVNLVFQISLHHLLIAKLCRIWSHDNRSLTLSLLMSHICGVSKSSVNGTRKQTNQKIQIN
jgi:hypothetical protein